MIVIIIFVLLIISYIACNFLYKRTNDYKNRFVTIRDYEQGVPKNIKIAAFGSTYGKYAFNSLKDYRFNSFNFCLEAEPLQCDLKILKKYSSNLAPGCLVFINLAACVTCCKEEEEVVLNSNNYYKLLNFNDLPIALKRNLRRWINYLLPIDIFNIKRFARLLIDKELVMDVTERHPVSVSEKAAIQNMQNIANCWINMFHLKDLKSIDIPNEIQTRVKVNEEVLTEIIDYCISNGWKPIVVIPPMSSELNNYFSDEFHQTVLINCINKSILNKDVIFCNFLNNKEFKENWTLYCDGGFRLNKYGSRKFIRELLYQINSKGIIANNSTLRV